MSHLGRDSFVRSHEGVHVMCACALPCIKTTIQKWRAQIQQNTGDCTKPNCATIGKPEPSTCCPTLCGLWGNASLAAEYTNPSRGIGTSTGWSNIYQTLLSKDPVEVAKTFVLRLPKGEPSPKSLDEFDTTSLLMITMKFKDFHQGDIRHYEAIKKVSSIKRVV